MVSAYPQEIYEQYSCWCSQVIDIIIPNQYYGQM